jgi:hypothetical protein
LCGIYISGVLKRKMLKRKFYDPYIEVVKKFNQHKVKYVVIGVAGINYYIDDVRKLFVTADFDIFVAAEEKNLLKALKILKKLKFDVIYKSKKIKCDLKEVKKIVNEKGTILAVDPYYNLGVELCLEVSGFTFEDVYSDKKIFYASGVKINVGKLEKLLKMKEIAGREKDIMFLEKYKLLFNE